MSQRVFCNFCLDFYGCLRDYEFHCIKKHSSYNLWNLSHFSTNYRIQNCKDTRNRSIYYFIFTFKPILGKDVTLLIAKLIHDQRLEEASIGIQTAADFPDQQLVNPVPELWLHEMIQ